MSMKKLYTSLFYNIFHSNVNWPIFGILGNNYVPEITNLVQRKMGWETQKVKEVFYTFLRVSEVPDNTGREWKEISGRSHQGGPWQQENTSLRREGKTVQSLSLVRENRKGGTTNIKFAFGVYIKHINEENRHSNTSQGQRVEAIHSLFWGFTEEMGIWEPRYWRFC